MADFEFPSSQARINNIDALPQEFFVGRTEELDILNGIVDGSLTVFTDTQQACFNSAFSKFPSEFGSQWVIHGTSGIGKSALIKQCLGQLKEASKFDVIWWLPSESISTLKVGIKQLADRVLEDNKLVVGGEFPSELDDYLSSVDRWLLVFDGFADDKFQAFFPKANNGCCFITTKVFEWENYEQVLSLNALTDADCMAIVNESSLKASEEEKQAFIEKMSRNPQNIVQALQYIELNEFSLTQYMNDFPTATIEHIQ